MITLPNGIPANAPTAIHRMPSAWKTLPDNAPEGLGEWWDYISKTIDNMEPLLGDSDIIKHFSFNVECTNKI